MIKKTTEIDAILLNLNKAIDAHYQWLVSMFHSVVARDASKPEITDNHSYGLCQFGRWIDHLGPLDNDELPYVRLMDLEERTGQCMRVSKPEEIAACLLTNKT